MGIETLTKAKYLGSLEKCLQKAMEDGFITAILSCPTQQLCRVKIETLLFLLKENKGLKKVWFGYNNNAQTVYPMEVRGDCFFVVSKHSKELIESWKEK